MRLYKTLDFIISADYTDTLSSSILITTTKYKAGEVLFPESLILPANTLAILEMDSGEHAITHSTNHTARIVSTGFFTSGTSYASSTNSLTTKIYTNGLKGYIYTSGGITITGVNIGVEFTALTSVLYTASISGTFGGGTVKVYKFA